VLVDVELWIRNYVNFEDKVGYMNFGGNFERTATANILTDIIRSMHHKIKCSVYGGSMGLCFDSSFHPCSSDLFRIGDQASPNQESVSKELTSP